MMSLDPPNSFIQTFMMKNKDGNEQIYMKIAGNMVQVSRENKLFMEWQGYPIEKNILYQDNKSAILLEENGRKSGIDNI